MKPQSGNNGNKPESPLSKLLLVNTLIVLLYYATKKLTSKDS
ncbi:MAG: hypothetical protein ACJAWT_000821 [Glaciecola sp.]|jgi:hypothetical protein